jgi:DNA-binding CsgD family transcriptional regulator
MPARSNYTFTLTPREVEVLQLLVQGKNCPQIAIELGISKNVAEQHSQKILEKAGVNRRKDLIPMADQLIKEAQGVST